jgi:OOP family OmpA-OmpF porin
VSKAANHSFGVNLGVRFFLHKAKEVEVAQTAPAVVEEEKEVVAVVTPTPEPEEDTADITPVVDVSTPILFDHDRNVIKKESYPILEEAVSELHDNKQKSVIIHGYTDNTGSAAYNAKLSLKRAAAVKSYLNKKGVNPKSIKTIGHGSKYPAASNKTAEGRARNRIAVMKLK